MSNKTYFFATVKAIFAGHHHTGNFAYYKNIPVVTVEGMIETENDNAFGIVEIFSDKIVLKGKGRMVSREFVTITNQPVIDAESKGWFCLPATQARACMQLLLHPSLPVSHVTLYERFGCIILMR